MYGGLPLGMIHNAIPHNYTMLKLFVSLSSLDSQRYHFASFASLTQLLTIHYRSMFTYHAAVSHAYMYYAQILPMHKMATRTMLAKSPSESAAR